MASRGVAIGIAVLIAAVAAVSAQAPAPAPAPGFPPPAALPEELGPTQDFPYLPPPPGTRLVQTRTITAPLELKQASANDEAVIAGRSHVRKTYEWALPRPSAPLLSSYRDGLFAAGWKVIDVTRIAEPPIDAGTVHVSAHYRENGRNLYAKVTQEPTGPLHIEVADVGAEDWAAALARECRIRVPSIHFELDGANVKLAESEPTLRKLAQLLAAQSVPITEIQGHVDSIGEEASTARQALSEKRAQSVVAWLTTHGGVPPNKVTAKGYGRTRPIADNDGDLGRALNRRIEVARRDCSR